MRRPGALALQIGGLALFLFIPAVLYLLVVHPEPVGLSLAGALGLFVLHRPLARRYARTALERKCLWCNKGLAAQGGVPLEIVTGALEGREGARVTARCCPHHQTPAARYLSFLDAARLPLRLGILAPLAILVLALAATAIGFEPDLPAVTAAFQLVISITVNVAANAYPWAPERRPPRVPFPLHNFTLLGLRTLLLIFRLVGLWWIVRGSLSLAAML